MKIKHKTEVYEVLGPIMHQNWGKFGLLRHPGGAGVGRDELESDLIQC